MLNDCPYCALAQKTGELFCSRHSTNMNSLDSGIFYIREREFEECDWHVTRLSLNFNLDDFQTYFVGSREYTISPTRFLLINEGQSFKTFAKSESENRMVTIAFKVGLANTIYQSLVLSNEGLLENPDNARQPLHFFERTYPLTPLLNRQVQMLIERPVEKDLFHDQLESILTKIVVEQHQLTSKALTIKKVKPSTRIEICKRLHWSLEYIHDNFSKRICVEELAKQACVSTFHFKRLFKEFFGVAPYQYIKRLRLEKASGLLTSGMAVSEVCKSVGWEDTSSFVRLFKNEMKVTPHQYRCRTNNRV